MTGRVLTCLLLTLAFLLPFTLPTSAADESGEPQPHAAETTTAEGPLSVGDLSQPAVADQAESGSTPASPFPDDYDVIEPEYWRVVHMVSPLSHGGTCKVTLLRPLPWLEVMGAEIGAVIEAHMPEMGISGEAEVLAIKPCPEHVGASKPGARPITGTFVSTNTPVIDLHIEGLTEPIGVTAGHPFWSLDRSDWIAAGDLRVGERLQSLRGEAIVEEIAPRHEPETVYNIEVHRQHSYYVSDARLVVHNMCNVSRIKPAKTVRAPGAGEGGAAFMGPDGTVYHGGFHVKVAEWLHAEKLWGTPYGPKADGWYEGILFPDGTFSGFQRSAD